MAGLYIGDTPINKVRIGVFSENGIDTSDATAAASDMAENKTAYVNGEKVTGNLPVYGGGSMHFDGTPSEDDSPTWETNVSYLGASEKSCLVAKYTIREDRICRTGYELKTAIRGSAFGDATADDVVAGKTFTSTAGLKVTGTHTCSGGVDTSDATATAEDILQGETAYVNGEKITGNVPFYLSKTFNHGEDDTTISFNESGNKITHRINTHERFALIGGSSSRINLNVPTSTYGDATSDDVISGKTFTSTAGLKVTGTHVCSGGIDTSDATATASDMAEGVTAYVNGEKVTGTLPHETLNLNISSNPSASGSNVKIEAYKSTGTKRIIGDGAALNALVPLSKFGDATAEDVAEGKTFTSSSGLLVTGTHVCSGGSVSSDNNCEAYHITSTSDTISFNGTGTVKVWGYGYKSGSYGRGTSYSFVGDGYYTSSSYGTPSKTTHTFSIGTDGTLSGLPSGLTTIDVIVTIGI